MNIKSLAIATLFAITSFTVNAMERPEWGCLTKTESLLILSYSEDQPIKLAYIPSDSNTPAVELVDTPGVSVGTYGQTTYAGGSAQYFRFSYLSVKGTLVSYVALNSEFRGGGFQGLKIYEDGVLVGKDECSEWVDEYIDPELDVPNDDIELVNVYGTGLND